MLRTFAGLFCGFIIASCNATAAPQKIVFERGPSIWLGNADGSGAEKITKGTAPDISPDEARIAFHTDETTNKDVTRHIAVVDVRTKKVTVFKKEIPSGNCQRAVWSPDGSRILFNIWSNSDWHLATINADGSDFRYVKKATPPHNSFWSACWAPDGNSIYAQDLNNLYRFGLDGNEMQKWSLESLFPKGSMNSGSHAAVSPDGKTLLLDIDMTDEEANMPDWDGPPPSVWTLEIANGKSTRLTPKGVLAWHGCWLGLKEVAYTSQSAKEKEPAIYRMNIADKEKKLLLKNANNPSASHP